MRNEKMLPTRYRLIYMQLDIYFERCIVWFCVSSYYQILNVESVLILYSMTYESNWPLSVIEASITTQKIITVTS